MLLENQKLKTFLANPFANPLVAGRHRERERGADSEPSRGQGCKSVGLPDEPVHPNAVRARCEYAQHHGAVPKPRNPLARRGRPRAPAVEPEEGERSAAQPSVRRAV